MEFKRISDAELVSVSEGTNLLVEVDGEVKRTASTEHTKVEKLKNLIAKFGGDSEGVQSVDEALDRLCACEIGGGGGGDGVSSWNDLTNRPFYEESEVVFEQVVDCITDMDGIYLGMIENPSFLPSNKTYKVIWDGTEYVCDAVSTESGPVIGNAGLLGGNFTSEPFVFAESDGMLIFAVTESGSYDVKIEEITIEKIPKHFLPDHLNVLVLRGKFNQTNVNEFTFNMSYNDILENFNNGNIIFAIVSEEGSIVKAYQFDKTDGFISERIVIGESTIAFEKTKISYNSGTWSYESKNASVPINA